MSRARIILVYSPLMFLKALKLIMMVVSLLGSCWFLIYLAAFYLHG